MEGEQLNDQKIQNPSKNKDILSALRQNNNALRNLLNNTSSNEIPLPPDEITFPPFKVLRIPRKNKASSINISTQKGKIIKIETNDINSNIDIKSIIQEKEGIPIEKQHLFYKDMELDDHSNILNFTKDDDTIHLVQFLDGNITIFIKSPDDIFPVNIKKTDTAKIVKSIIMDKKGYLIDDQALESSGNEYQDDETFFNNFTINLALKSNSIKIRIRTGYSSPKEKTFYVNKSDKIIDIKERYWDAVGIKVSSQTYFYGGKKLENDHTVDDYHLHNDSCIFLHYIMGR